MDNYSGNMASKSYITNGNPYGIEVFPVARVDEGRKVQIPSINQYQAVEITSPSGMNETKNKENVLENEFYIDYTAQIILFHQCMKNQLVHLRYYMTAEDLFSASRIFTSLDNKGDVKETLDDLFKEQHEVIDLIKSEGSAMKFVNDLKEQNINGQNTSNDLQEKIIGGIRTSNQLKEDTLKAEETNTNLNATNVEAIKTNATLNASRVKAEETIVKATEIKNQLEPITVRAETIKPLLDESCNRGELVKAELDESIQRGDIPTMKEEIRTTRKYPIATFEIAEEVVRKDLPYFHVERYGADPRGIVCSSNAIQICIDMCERISSMKLGSYPIVFGNGTYLITKPLKIKCIRTEGTVSRPITFLGVERRCFYGYEGHGTVIIPKIPNFTGKDYANIFTINLTFNPNDENDLIGEVAQMPSNMIDNLTFKNLIFILSETDRYNYNINIIKGFRTRLHVENICALGVNKVVWQDYGDSVGNFNYCDSSIYRDIYTNYIKTSVLELHYADNTEISGIVCAYPEPTMNNYIFIHHGAGITIDKILFSFHSKYKVTYDNPRLIPRNDGIVGGNNAYIKLENVNGVHIRGIDVERTMLTSLFNILNSHNITVDNSYEKFIGNNFIAFRGINSNITLNNINRHMNIVSGFMDIDWRTGAKVKGLKINNFRRKNFYTQDDFTLQYTDEQYLAVTESNTVTYKHITSNFTRGMEIDTELERLTLQVRTDGSIVNIADRNENVDVYMKYITGVVDNDGIILSHVEPKAFMILKNVQPLYKGKAIVPSIPVLRNMNGDKVHFIKNNAFMSTMDESCSFLVTFETLKI